jgi:ankyrin repeat protein
MLKNIHEKNREHARRLLHCLAVAVRPLRVEELAEILAFDFEGIQGRIPKFHAEKRPEDQEKAVLSTCPSLITIVYNRDSSPVVQFSHLSVKEYLTSNHFVSSSSDLSMYHILPEPSHTLLAQVCLGLLLDSDGREHKNGKGSPLAKYAARHWVTHAQFEDVASRVMGAMKSLFDPDKPHFATWIDLFDIDAESGWRLPSEKPSPMYYAALCGFPDLVQHLAIKHPRHVDSIGGSYGFPLFAALCRNHFGVVEILLKRGGSVDVRDKREQTALHKTILDRNGEVAVDAIRFLLEHGADVNARRDDLCTPLHLAVNTGDLSMTRMLLDHQADINSRNDDGQTPLHLAVLSRRETSQDEEDGCDLATLLLERGANSNEQDKNNATPLHLACYYKKLKIVRVLLNHHAKANTKTNTGDTALHGVSCIKYESQEDGARVAQLLLECGMDVNARGKDHSTPLHVASYNGKHAIAQLLLSRGAKADTENDRGETPLHSVAMGRHEFQEDGVRIAQQLLEHGVDMNAQCKNHSTPLHIAVYNGKFAIVRLLLDHGANANAKTDDGVTPLHLVSWSRYESQRGVRVVLLLLECGADVNAQRKDLWTPLHVASYHGKHAIARLLLDCGAISNAEDSFGETPLHSVSGGKYDSQEDGVRIVQLLLDTRDSSDQTPLYVALKHGKKANLELTQLLLENGGTSFRWLDPTSWASSGKW